MNKRAPAASFLPAKATAQLVPATFNVRGLSLPDQTRVVARRHLDRLLVSLQRAVVSRSSLR